LICWAGEQVQGKLTMSEDEIRRIAILTSGGDCGGLNGVIRGAVAAASGRGWEIVGIEQGTHGLLDRPPAVRALDTEMFDGTVLRHGGTLLGTTNKGNPFAFPMPDGSTLDRSQEIIEAYQALGFDALIGIGGDGSLAILRQLAEAGGIRLIGIPKTIDNDVGATEFSVGYATAVDVATQALDMLQPTAASHSRVMILEVMGRDAGHIAIAAGIAGGADIVLIPEIAYKLESITSKIQRLRDGGRNHALVVAAEAVPKGHAELAGGSASGSANGSLGIGAFLAEKIAAATGAETRVTVLGHVQRGAPPSPQDRLVGQAFGVAAIEAIAAGKSDRLLIWRDRAIVDMDLETAIAAPGQVDPEGLLVHTARGLDICLGDN
jgi:6-phosphofructokinase 1